MQKEHAYTLELFAEELPNHANLTATPISSWASITTFSTVTTQYSTTSTSACSSSLG